MCFVTKRSKRQKKTLR